MEKQERSQKWLIVALIALVVFGVVIFKQYEIIQSKQNAYDELESLQETTLDRLQYFKDADGEKRARISRFETEKTQDFLKYQTADSEVKFLQQRVAKYEKEIRKGGSVSVIESETKGSGKVATTIEPTREPNFPTYRSAINLGGLDSNGTYRKWVLGESIANKDSTSYIIQTNDRITLVLGSEKTGFLGLGRGKPFADITNENPYSTTKSLRSYSVTPEKQKRWTIGAGATYGIVLPNNGTVGFGGAVGLTASYSFLNF